MSNAYWKKQEEKYLKAISEVEIPDEQLNNVDYIDLKEKKDIEVIPEKGGGCYWIWTNEPIKHYFHKHITPQKFNNGEIIYNGITLKNVRARVNHHLIGEIGAGWSGISIDLYFGETTSHRKKALSEKGKVPYIFESNRYIPIRNKEQLLKITNFKKESELINNNDFKKIYFRNGINVFEEKHSKYLFRVFYITRLTSLYTEYIEKKWREKYGLPKLCSYSKGR